MLALTLNGVPQGDVAALYDQDQYWITAEALKGFELDTTQSILYEGQRYFLISALKGLQSQF
ncbi:MAG: hypothetical protein ACRC01_07095, partial [Deefgea sp.]